MTHGVEREAMEEAASRLVAAAIAAGADAADVVVVRSIALSSEVREGALEETERSEGDGVTLRAFVGRRSASVSANAITRADGLAERVVAMARLAPEDRFAGLAARDMLASPAVAAIDLDLSDGGETEPATLAAAAFELEAAMRGVAGVTRSGGAGASWSRGGLVLATSEGFVGSYVVSRQRRWATAIAGEGTGMERDWWSEAAVHPEDLPANAEIGRRAGALAVRRLAPRRIATTTATVVFDPRAAASLVGHLAGAINGAAVARGATFLKDRLGERVFRPGIRIVDDPTRRRGLASRPFDAEGVAGRPLDVVDDGVVTTWLLDSTTGRELGLATNGRAARGGGAPSPSATNLALMPGETDPAALMAAIGTGFYVTDLIGHGADIVTGDYSRGASGFWFENGVLAYPVSEVTIAATLPEIFARMTPANDLEYRSSVNAPTVAVEGMTIAGR